MLKKSKFGGTFRHPIFLYFVNYQCDSSSIQRFFHGAHGVGLGFFCDVDVGFHGFVVGMAGKFHHDLRGDTDGEHEADEGLSAAVGADFAVFGNRDVVALPFAESGDVGGAVEFAELTDFLDVLVHLLVGDDGKGKVSGEILVFVFVQDGLGVGVELDLQAGVGLLGDNGDGAVLGVVWKPKEYRVLISPAPQKTPLNAFERG